MIIVITGATSGIGEATALYLSQKGHTIYSLARRVGSQPNIQYRTCDVTKMEEIQAALASIVEKEGKIDVLINNAGMGISGALEFTTIEDIQKINDVNWLGLVHVTRLTIPYLRESKGMIVNIGSVAGELAIPFQTMYSATKAAVHSFSEGLANELRPLGVRVSCVMPGDTKTAFTDNRKKNEDDVIYAQRVQRSIQKMENDEQKGVDPVVVAKVVEKCIHAKKPPVKVAVGFNYKLLVFLKKVLPNRLIQYILFKMYG